MSNPNSIESNNSIELSAQRIAEAQKLRKSRVKSSISSSIVSKVFGALTPLLIIPLAQTHLGDSYPAYIALMSLVTLINTFNLGFGPAVTFKVAKFAIEPNHTEERRLYASSFFACLASSSILALAILLIAPFAPMEAIFGSNLSRHEESLRIGLLILAGLTLFSTFQNAAINMYKGYMEVHKIRLAMATSYLLAAVLAPIVILSTKSVVWTFAVMTATPALAQTSLLIKLLYQDRKYLRHSLAACDRAEAAQIFRDNMAQTGSSVGALFARQIPIIAAGFLASSQVVVGQAGTFLIWMSVIVSISQMIIESTSITVSNAYQEHDWNYIDRANAKLRKLLLIAAPTGLLVAGSIGPLVLNLVSRGDYRVGPIECLFLGGAIIAATFMTWWQYYAISLGMFKSASIGGLIQAIAVVLILVPISQFNGFILEGTAIIVADTACGLYLLKAFRDKRAACLVAGKPV
jgi:hypothetical protein